MKILIVDDEKSLRLALSDELCEQGYKVDTADCGEEAVKKLQRSSFDLVISDVIMGDIGGFEILEFLKSINCETKLILMTAYGTIDAAVNAVKAGAIDYICKPFEIDHLLRYLKNIKETIELRQENSKLKTILKHQKAFISIVGNSAPMQHMFSLLEAVSDTSATILIEGETGTGKELVAEAIHNRSARRNMPFIAVSCAALNRELLESELFGYEQGAFTGAVRQKRGRFELANGGTLFLDEVDDIPIETQVKLLRVLQSGRFERVGGEAEISIDVRIIGATKTNLEVLVKEGKMRQDFYYRLNVIHVAIPPLRNRKEDIPLLVGHFLQKFSPDQPLEVSSEILDLFTRYEWEGNIRELEHAIERLVLLRKDGKIDITALPGRILHHKSPNEFQLGVDSLPEYLDRTEKVILESALQKASGNKTIAADLLNIPLSTFKSKLGKFSS